ncbi:MAG TPA: helix-turn-helix domain-containing protein [Candidatus Onthousia excrementipullorum]|uniref:Helix-turn-helix domain-containing protein n=1 Tax=Candidatus Onthousia excrementipullorum TaxID=2840884 RepID=A0A9D1DT33_9FIRM|nr:helix-turn-helix domain-containing protein [Candidatus Onthousia excrementipullorum]
MKDLATYNMLKNVTLADVIRIVIENDNLDINIVNEEKEVYYTSKDLIDLYPNIFSKYKLARYIKEENFPVIKDGKERFFPKSSVEKWLENKNNQAMFRGI